jgi:transposase InsO family protein
MIYHLLLCFVSLVLDLLASAGVATEEKDLEIALLRQQLRVMERKTKHKARPARPEKLMLVALADKLKKNPDHFHSRLQRCVLLIKPETLLKGHRELVRRKWTFHHPARGGRPRIDAELEALILRLVRENPRMGYHKIHGELLKLGYRLNPITVRNVLRRHHFPPAPQRGCSSWRSFLKHYREPMLACAFFTVETTRLQTIYVLFFIELGSRRVHLAGCTPAPDSAWVSQQARQLVWHLTDRSANTRFLIHDHDSKFTSAFDSVFVSEGIEIVFTPFQAPKANTYAERWVRSVREECLDHLLIPNHRHLWRVLCDYGDYYNAARPHQGLGLQSPVPAARIMLEGRIHCRDVLGGILHDYSRQAVTYPDEVFQPYRVFLDDHVL